MTRKIVIYNYLLRKINKIQLENIERTFSDFEKVMESNDYSEVVHVVKALDAMIEHMEIVINEVPDILLMINQVIPNRMREVEINYQELTDRGFPLEYLNIEYNIEYKKAYYLITSNVCLTIASSSFVGIT